MVVGGVQKLLFDAESKNHKIPNSHYGVGGGGVQKLLFDAESKNHKIPNSHYGWGGGREIRQKCFCLNPESKCERILYFKPCVYLAYFRSYCYLKIVKCIAMY